MALPAHIPQAKAWGFGGRSINKKFLIFTDPSQRTQDILLLLSRNPPRVHGSASYQNVELHEKNTPLLLSAHSSYQPFSNSILVFFQDTSKNLPTSDSRAENVVSPMPHVTRAAQSFGSESVQSHI